MRNLLIFVVVAIVGVVLRVMQRPVIEVYNVPEDKIKNGQIRMHYQPITDSQKILQHLTVIIEVIMRLKVASCYVVA